jgi:hypothetical protein
MSDSSPDAQQQFELAKKELQLALMFAKVSSSAYSQGKLQHAWDARSKAEAVRARAVAQLVGAVAASDEALDAMLGEVQDALATVPSGSEPYFWTRPAFRRTAV